MPRKTAAVAVAGPSSSSKAAPLSQASAGHKRSKSASTTTTTTTTTAKSAGNKKKQQQQSLGIEPEDYGGDSSDGSFDANTQAPVPEEEQVFTVGSYQGETHLLA